MDTSRLTALKIQMLDAIGLGEQAVRISHIGRQIVNEIDILSQAASKLDTNSSAQSIQAKLRLDFLENLLAEYKTNIK